jgi:hypothetical protein
MGWKRYHGLNTYRHVWFFNTTQSIIGPSQILNCTNRVVVRDITATSHIYCKNLTTLTFYIHTRTFTYGWYSTKYMELCRQLRSYSRISKYFMESRVHCRDHKGSPPALILSQINPVHTIPPYLYKIHFNTIFPVRLNFLVVSFLLALPSKSYMRSSPPTRRDTCVDQLIPLDLIILNILGEVYKIRSSSLCSFLQPPITSSLFGPNILLFSRAVSLRSSLNVRDQVSHP